MQRITHKREEIQDFKFRYIESLLRSFNENLDKEIRNAWLELEQGETREAQYIYEIDKLEYIIQTYEYKQKIYEKKNLEEF